TTVCVVVVLCGLWVVSETAVLLQPGVTIADVLRCIRKHHLAFPIPVDEAENSKIEEDDRCQQLLRNFSSEDIKCLFSPIRCMFRDYGRSR
ncbi:hypothetical protein OESDEN_17592, partial [Oesophagostomum dentatum]